MAIEKDKLMKVINTVSFALNDIVLYLDTHPCDKDALDQYDKYKAIRSQAMKEYSANYGPLLNDNVTSTGKWAWVQTPWPWETEGN